MVALGPFSFSAPLPSPCKATLPVSFAYLDAAATGIDQADLEEEAFPLISHGTGDRRPRHPAVAAPAVPASGNCRHSEAAGAKSSNLRRLIQFVVSKIFLFFLLVDLDCRGACHPQILNRRDATGYRLES